MNDFTRGMKNKTIKRALNLKLEEWICSIDDVGLQAQVLRDVVVTGGSICSMLMGEPINDYDVYFKTSITANNVAKYYVEKMNYGDTKIEQFENRVRIFVQSSGIVEDPTAMIEENEDEMVADEDPDKKYRPVFISENAITPSDRMQLVMRFCGSVEEVHKNFDYVHATCSYDYSKQELITPLGALRSMQSRTLYYQGSLYPVCSLFRLRKFIARGWRISAGDILKISLQISDLDLRDKEVLRDQCTGVDGLYFHAFLQAVEGLKPERLTLSYLSVVLDRIFNGE